MDPVKCLAKGPLADRKGGTQGRNLDRIVDFGERQNFSLFDDVPGRIVSGCTG
ncbi:hypothetical protein SAMN05444321_6420 [Bradyrhizobium lablabi]|nr:hypothetical protein SAMN05444321_6420 [Bradyrhizobium lablabi]